MKCDILQETEAVDLQHAEAVDWIDIFTCCAYSQFSSLLDALDEE